MKGDLRFTLGLQLTTTKGKKMFTFNLGDRVKCAVTGFEGIAVSRTQYINGCIRYGVQSDKLSPEGKIVDPEWIDQKQLTLMTPSVVIMQQTADGGPAPAPRLEPNPR